MRSADRSSLRIERDKARLEQHYQDAMSFLNRVDDGRSLVEEQELETATVDRLQLQKYAREAMSFLNKAFRGDSSVLVDDDDGSGRNSKVLDGHGDLLPEEKHQLDDGYDYGAMEDNRILPTDGTDGPEDTNNQFRKVNDSLLVDHTNRADGSGAADEQGLLANQIDHELEDGDNLPLTEVNPRVVQRKGPVSRLPRRHQRTDEDRQIAADRAALERYDEEIREFLSRAYLDDSTVIVDDADESEISATDYELHGVPKLTASENSAYGDQVPDDDGDDDAFTDEEFQDPLPSRDDATEERFPSTALHNDIHSVNSSADMSGDMNHNLLRRMEIFEREAAGYMEDVNVSEEEEAETEQPEETEKNRNNVDFPKRDPSVFAPGSSVDKNIRNGSPHVFPGSLTVSDEKNGPHGFDINDGGGIETKADAKALSIVSLGSEPKLSEENRISNTDEALLKPSEILKWDKRGKDKKASGDNDSPGPRREHPDGVSNKPQQGGDVTMDLRLEDQSGRSEEWCGVQMKTSFYRQIPRGSTIKLRPRASEEDVRWRAHDDIPRTSDGRVITISALQRVEKERDVLMATLEEIVNERSMLAAQITEMKSIFPDSRGQQRNSTSSSSSSKLEDIDLAAELRDAHRIMAKLTEEMEETLSILDKRYQDSLDRAHKAEERCIRLESNSYRLHSEFTAQGKRLTKSHAEERRLLGLLDGRQEELKTLRSKSEQDAIRMEEQYRMESERSESRIQELTDESVLLQEKLTLENKRVESCNANAMAARHLEAEMGSLKRRLAESERVLARERLNAKKNEDEEQERCKRKVDEEVGNAHRQLREAESLAKIEVERLERDLRALKNGNANMANEMNELIERNKRFEYEVAEARRRETAAEAEAVQIRSRYKQLAQGRISELDQSAELGEIQCSLSALKEGATQREGILEKQLEEFRSRAEQAEAAAIAAENGAKEATEIAKMAQERSRSAIEAERAARQAAESDREVIASEWEQFKKQQQAKEELAANLPVAKSSSRRGLRKSSSKSAKDAEKKKKESKPGGSEDGHLLRKRAPHRARLFG